MWKRGSRSVQLKLVERITFTVGRAGKMEVKDKSLCVRDKTLKNVSNNSATIFSANVRTAME